MTSFYEETFSVKLFIPEYLELLNDIACDSKFDFSGCKVIDIMFILGVIFNKIYIGQDVKYVILEVTAIEAIKWLYDKDYFARVPARITLKNIKLYETENVIRLNLHRAKLSW